MSDFIDPSSTPAVSDTPAPQSTPAPAISGTPAPQTATPPATPAPATSAPGEAQVPSYRLRQQRDQYEQRIAQMESTYKAQLEQEQRRIQALVGVNPPANTEVDQIRQQFSQLYPGLSKMEEKAALFEQLIARSQDLEQQTQHYWTTYGRQTMDRLFSKASESLGGNLSDAGKEQLHAAFVGYVQANPDREARYSNDPTIVDDFWKVFSSNLIDPVRRTAAANMSERVPPPLPQDTPGGIPRSTPTPQNASLDERMNMAWAQYNKFGR